MITKNKKQNYNAAENAVEKKKNNNNNNNNNMKDIIIIIIVIIIIITILLYFLFYLKSFHWLCLDIQQNVFVMVIYPLKNSLY